MKTRYTFFVIVLVTCMLLPSCTTAPQTSQPVGSNTTVPTTSQISSAGQLTLGIVYSQEDSALQTGIKEMGDTLGITLSEASTNGNAADISSNIDSMVQAGVKGILIIHSATDDIKDSILKASQAGVKIVTLGDIPNPKLDGVSTEVLLDNYDLGFVSLKSAFKAVGYKGLLAVVGTSGTKSLELRTRVVQLMEDMYTNVKDVRYGTSADTHENIVAKTKDTLAANPNIGAFWCSSIEFAQGVDDALTQLGKTNIPVYATNDGLTVDEINLMTTANSPLMEIVYTDHKEAGQASLRLLASAVLGDPELRYAFILANTLSQVDAKALGSGKVPDSKIDDIGWGDALMAMYAKKDPIAATAVRQTLNDINDAILKTHLVTLPDPAQLPTDFSVKTLTIAGVHEETNYQHNELLRSGMDEIAKQFNVKLLSSNASSDWSKMASDLDTFIAQGVDAIVVDHGSTESMEPEIKKALDKGIPVVTFDCPTPDLAQVSSQISQDDYGHAFMSLRPMISQIGGKGKIGVAWLGGYAPLENRMRVLRMELELFPDITTKEFGEDVANYVDDAMSKTEALLGGNPDIVAFWATWDGLATGIDEALVQMKRTDIPLYSVDVSSEDIQRMVEPGSPWKLTATSDPVEVGKVIMLTIIAAAYKQPTPMFISIPAYSVSQEQARLLEPGKLPTPPASGEGWTPFLVALRNKINP